MNGQNTAKIQGTLKNFFEENTWCKRILPYSGILLYIYTVISAVQLLPLPGTIASMFGYLTAILYFLYILGLLMCYSKNECIPIFAAFAYHAILPVVSAAKWGFAVNGFNNTVNVVVYGLLSYWALKKVLSNRSAAGAGQYCAQCGKPVSGTSKFCGSCGAQTNKN